MPKNICPVSKSDTAALVTLYSYKEDGTAYMTQYPEDPNS